MEEPDDDGGGCNRVREHVHHRGHVRGYAQVELVLFLAELCWSYPWLPLLNRFLGRVTLSYALFSQQRPDVFYNLLSIYL